MSRCAKPDRPRPRLLGLTLLAGLAMAACSESPFAPAPSVRTCGASDWPCPFDCQLDCAGRALRAAGSCLSTLEGTLDASRTTCSFPDGGRVLFRGRVPTLPSDLRSQAWDFTVERGGKICLDLRMQTPTLEEGWLRTSITLAQAGDEYQQELWLAAGDAGAAVGPERARVRCPDGRTHAGLARDCSVCADAGTCSLDGLLELAVTGEKLLEFTLRSGSDVTPLFTCR